MEFVCKDADGLSDWNYDADTQQYLRVFLDGRAYSIKAEYLLNPSIAWTRRCQFAGLTPSSMEGKLLRPDDVTFTLWNDWIIRNANL